MHSVYRMADLQDDIKVLEAEFTKLVLNLTGVDPEDAFSDIPYVKGNVVQMSLVYC